MGKLFKLKKWLTVSDTAKHLTVLLGEEVSDADVLQLALDGLLTLSANFVNHATAYRATRVPLNEVPTIAGLHGEKVYIATRLNDGTGLKFDDQPIRITGVWDLPLLGAERLDVQNRVQSLLGGPGVDLLCLEGAFVSGGDGELFQLQVHFDEAVTGRAGYYPAGGLPEDCMLVVRTEALRAFEQAMGDQTEGVDRPLRTRERRTWLTVISALFNLARITPDAYGTAKLIAGETDRMGTSVSADAIGKIIQQIPEALETRRK
jgi:hypothetical protein